MADPEDPSALALVMDDDHAPAFLMWWANLGHLDPSLESAAVACQTTPDIVRNVQERCEMAGLLTDDGITPLALKFVQTHVSRRLVSGK